MREETENIIYLDKKVPRNYDSSLNKQGDCGACVLAGLLSITVEQAYELHESGSYYGGEPIPKISALSRSSMLRTLEKLESNKQIQHLVQHTPIFPFSVYKEQGSPFGLSAGLQFDAWTDYIRILLTAGYYGVAQVYNNGHNQNTLNEYGMTNHWVLIKGWRMQWRYDEKGSGSGQQEICISNSARNAQHEQWIYVGDFLKNWGGFDAYWVKLD